MSDAPPDPFATAKANLRDTVKWLATTLAALTAAVAAGASLNGIPALPIDRLVPALIGGLFGLVCLLLAIGRTLSLLTTESFYAGQLVSDRNIEAEIDAHADDILPLPFANIRDLINKRKEAIEDIREATPGSPAATAATTFYASLDGHLGRIVSLGHFLDMRRRLEGSKRALFLLSIGAFAGLGTFAVLSGKGDAAIKSTPSSRAQLVPGPAWDSVAKALSGACGDGALVAAATPKKGFPNWSSFQVQGPAPCAGLELDLPSSVAAP